MRNVLFNFCVCVAVATWGVSIGGGAQGPLCHSDHYAAETRVFLIVLGANLEILCVELMWSVRSTIFVIQNIMHTSLLENFDAALA